MIRRRFKASKLLVVIVAIIGIVLAVNFVSRIQLLMSEASIPQSVGEVVAESEKLENGLTRVDVYFRTGLSEDNLEAMSYLSFRVGVASFLGVVDERGSQIEEIFVDESLRNSENWEFPVNKVVVGDSKTQIDFAAVNMTKDGFSSIENRKLATFYIDTADYVGDIVLDVDEDFSYIYSKERPVTNIWKVSAKLPLSTSN